MAPRLKKILRRTLIAVAVLAVLGLAAFTWVAYWPLEGSVDRIETLVPEGVDFAYRASWRELRSQPWVQSNVFDRPFLPVVDEAVGYVRQEIAPQIEDLERQVNAAIPLGIAKFSVEDDLFGAESVFCGRFCEGWGPERGRPLHPKEWLFLTRTTWKPRFVSALKHAFVRKRLGPRVEADVTEDEAVYQLVLHGVPVTDVKARSGCGEGFIIPPENVLYLTRVKDVLAFSNSKALAHDVADLGRAGEAARSFADRPDFSLQAPSGALAAAIDVAPLHQYMDRTVETVGPVARLLDRFVTARALDKLNGVLEVPSRDVLSLRTEILYEFKQLAPGVDQVWALSPEPYRDAGIARLVPAADTFGLLYLRSPPLHLLTSIWAEALSPGDRDLVLDNIRRQGKYQTIDEFFRELAERVGDTAGIAIARLSDPFDKVEYPEWYGDPGTDPDPKPGFALLVRLRQAAEPKEVDEFLADRLVALGLKNGVQRKEYRGIPYALLEIEQKSADYLLATPAYTLIQDHLVIASNEGYFRKILDTIAGEPSLAADPTFQASVALLPEKANVAAFLDLDKLYRVPPDLSPGGQPRGFQWDGRNLWVITQRDEREEGIRYRNELMKPFYEGRRTPTPQQTAEIERKVDEHLADWKARYPEFLEEYRKNLLQYRHLRAVALAFTMSRETVQGRYALLLQQGEAKAP